MSETKDKRYDPRMGDESPSEEDPPSSPRRPSARKRVHMDRHPTFEESAPRRYPASSTISSDTHHKQHRVHGYSKDDEEGEGEEEEKPARPWWGWDRLLRASPVDLGWIPANWSWSKIKPVVRCAVTGWISVLFFVVPQLEVVLGQVRVF